MLGARRGACGDLRAARSQPVCAGRLPASPTTRAQANREELQNAFFRDLRMSQDDGFHVIARHLANPATAI